MIDLDDGAEIQRADRNGALLRSAYAGAVLRRGYDSAEEAGVRPGEPGAVRSIVIAPSPALRGTAELLVALVAPVAPAPLLIATDIDHAHGWLSTADEVVVLSASGSEEASLQTLTASIARGCEVVVAAPPSSVLAESARTSRVPVVGWPAPDASDVLWTALAVLLRTVGLSGSDMERLVADLDDRAAALGPDVPTVANPAKQAGAALVGPGAVVAFDDDLSAAVGDALADGMLSGSGTVVGRADLRVAAGALERLLEDESAAGEDIFHDPFIDPEREPVAPRTRIVLVAHGPDDEMQRTLIEHASGRGVTMVVLEPASQDPLGRSCQLVLIGRLAAGYAVIAGTGTR